MSDRVQAYRGALEAVDRILNRGGDADDVLRELVDLLHDRFDRYSWVGISFVEGEELALGPWRGKESAAPATGFPIRFEGEQVALLDVRGADDEDRAFLER